MSLRIFVSVVALIMVPLAYAQQLDSVHVFRTIPEVAYTTASANTLAWRLHNEHAEHRTVKGPQLTSATEALTNYKPVRHLPGKLEELSHVAIAFSNGRPVAFGVTEDLGLIINFTARMEYRISSMAEHIRVRALLAKMLLEL
ncbi:MAG: hypothetical protein WAR83_11460 [Flavobacteriales bacterium]